MLSVELHAHSAASYDGRDSVDMLLERAAAVGLDALAVTDHDEVSANDVLVDRAPEYGLVGIPGVEVSSAAGHVLGLNVTDAIEPGLPFDETIERIRDQGGIAVVPHPFQEMRSGVLANVGKAELRAADAVEVYNSRLVTGYSNRQARRFAERYDLPITAGSDAHVSDMVGRAVTLVEAEDATVESICDAVADGRTTLQTRRTPWLVSARQAYGNTRRRIRLALDGLFS
ncbi:PHP domain-containing protein [Halosimplex litoreum]|uniref:PHP domain-containing protein n=1 Tax=Halosimplex litoreum TaxID=1198301 RepID=A0A7T3FZF9_9EURY|nr:PHP domain-containing protein [Halosimplex litoreum]QPV63535.1 PHP domain-containing protein [Halosimplex litoreum]